MQTPKLISFVNAHYGPIRGLSFVVNGEKDTLSEWLESQPFHLISAIWAQTLLSTRAMVLPLELETEMETPPQRVDSLADGESHILEAVTAGKLTGDPFFFRSFIL